MTFTITLPAWFCWVFVFATTISCLLSLINLWITWQCVKLQRRFVRSVAHGR